MYIVWIWGQLSKDFKHYVFDRIEILKCIPVNLNKKMYMYIDLIEIVICQVLWLLEKLIDMIVHNNYNVRASLMS